MNCAPDKNDRTSDDSEESFDVPEPVLFSSRRHPPQERHARLMLRFRLAVVRLHDIGVGAGKNLVPAGDFRRLLAILRLGDGLEGMRRGIAMTKAQLREA
jgi:hypothetical protein